MARIALVHPALGGHVGPARRLGAALGKAGHEVLESRPDGSFGPLSENAWREELTPQAAPVFEPLADWTEIAAALAEATVSTTRPLVEALMAAEVDLVVFDMMAPWGRVAAKWLGLPGLSSWPIFPRYEDPGEEPSPPAPDALARLGAAVEAVHRTWGHRLGEGSDIFANRGDLTAVFTTPEVIGPGALDPTYRAVGPLMGDEYERDEPALAGWDDERPLVYMALGTIFTQRPEMFRAALDGLADEPVRVLVSTWMRYTAQDLAPVPDNARVVERVASRAVLGRAAVHLTHGGANSVHESFLAGVPMLCVPQGSDHAAWAARVEALGAGEILQDRSPPGVRAGVRRLLADAQAARRAREVGDGLRVYDGARVAQEAVEELLG